jgi:hypothetical protein
MAGATNKKRKAPSQALRVAQLRSTYVPFKRTRSDALSSVEVSKLVEVHSDWLYSYEENEKLPNGIPPLPEYGGNLSVRKPRNIKPRVPFGQDEAIFRSSQLNESCWAIDGQQTLRTKSMGLCRMISALCSREFGFGLHLSVEQLRKVNVRTVCNMY